jgi:hypothetical protein
MKALIWVIQMLTSRQSAELDQHQFLLNVFTNQNGHDQTKDFKSSLPPMS